jgi:uncharacterized membrane protein
MSVLAAWAFPDGDSGARGERLAAAAAADRELVLDDAVVLRRAAGRGAPAYRRMYGVALSAPWTDTLWGLLLDIVVRAPSLEPVGPADRLLTAAGVSEEFVRGLREALEPGGTALFAVGPASSVATLDDVLSAGAARAVRSPTATWD